MIHFSFMGKPEYGESRVSVLDSETDSPIWQKKFSQRNMSVNYHILKTIVLLRHSGSKQFRNVIVIPDIKII